MVEVGVPASDGGGIDKRTLLIGAVIIGGAIGAFVLISRKTSAPSASTENKPQDADTLGLAYQNLATQLLGFRGDVSVANAKLDQGQQDTLTAIGNESAARASSDADLMSQIANLLQYSRGINSNLTAAQNDITTRLLNPEYRPPANTGAILDQSSGAGGYTPRQAILAALGANDDGDYYLAHMSAGPVRRLTSREY